MGSAATTIHPHVRVRLSDGNKAELQHGDLIGRLWSAALPIDDPRISEAHAFVSLRTNGFWLLSLRRMVAVAGKAVSEVALRRWDVSLARLRVRLREARVRHDLVTTDKNGIYALLLREGDEVASPGRGMLRA